MPAPGLETVRSRVHEAERKAGRGNGSVNIIAVSKTFDSDAIRPIIAARQTHFGENRVQEAARKWPQLRDTDPGLTLHLIGPMQSNKVRDAVALFDVIHTIDRDKIAGTMAAEIRRQNRTPDLMVQINTGGEPQKAGVLPQEADAFVARCRDHHGLALCGLMCIPPVQDDPAPHFILLAETAARLGLPRLSMGMSADFETAVSLGATDIRVGSAIFGGRPPLQPSA
jgi:pyridoxal phosphate enzyme (YggS family)